MIKYGNWECKKEFDIEDWFGFIYRITELDTGREYIGKKQLFMMRRVAVKGRKNKKITYKESDWKKYTGSCKDLNEQIKLKGMDNYKFEIISLHKTKASLYYAEVKRQVMEDVMRIRLPDGTKKYYNGQIGAVKFKVPEELKEELDFNTL
jgi:hypothetical protein